jgi:hypothetical protein
MVLEIRDDPAMRYGAQTLNPLDPRSQNEDLGDDAVYASELGLANLKRIVPQLQEWVNEDGEDYSTLEELYNNVVAQWGRYLGHVSRNVGGVMIDPKTTDEAGNVYTPVPADRQREAMAFLISQGFSRQDWLLDPSLLRRIEPAGAATRVRGLQESTLNRLLDPTRLSRMLESEWVDGETGYTSVDLLTDLRRGLWSEIERGAAIDPSRRTLQRAYVDRLGGILDGTASDGLTPQLQQRMLGYQPLDADRSDVKPLVRGELLTLQESVQQALRRYRNPASRMERLHLIDIGARIDDILNPED